MLHGSQLLLISHQCACQSLNMCASYPTTCQPKKQAHAAGLPNRSSKRNSLNVSVSLCEPLPPSARSIFGPQPYNSVQHSKILPSLRLKRTTCFERHSRLGQSITLVSCGGMHPYRTPPGWRASSITSDCGTSGVGYSSLQAQCNPAGAGVVRYPQGYARRVGKWNSTGLGTVRRLILQLNLPEDEPGCSIVN